MIDDLLSRPQALGPVGPVAPGTAARKPTITTGPSFSEVLADKAVIEKKVPTAAFQGPSGATTLKLSAHAQTRLQSRNIELTPQDWDKIQKGVDQAAAKGAKEALVVSDKAALVVSIKNRTVITAVDPASMKDNVFTHIDSAVLV